MDWKGEILGCWPGDLQKTRHAQLAIQLVEDGLAKLASMGFPLHVEEGLQPAQKSPWPRFVFHLREGPRICNCQADYEELGANWHFSMEEARQAAGMAKQMQRGGIFSGNIPARLEDVIFRREAEPPTPAFTSNNARINSLRPANYPVPAVIMPGTKVG